MIEIVKYKGIPFAFNNQQTLVIPPIAIGYLEQLQERVSLVNGNTLDPEQISTIIDTLYIALRRNYPDMTREDVADLVDLGTMTEAFECAMDISGMKRKGLAPGEILGN